MPGHGLAGLAATHLSCRCAGTHDHSPAGCSPARFMRMWCADVSLAGCRDKLGKLEGRRNKDEEQLHKALDASQRLE